MATQMQATEKNAGFKLNRFEVYNWGTFHDRVWTLEAEGFGALLTGENGSGKSTLVDGLLTLLVPNQKRNYNLASGSEKKERTELTYARGAYGREQNELGQGQIKYLRSDADYSVLMAQFKDGLTGDSITVAQFFWIEQSSLHKFYLTSHAELSVAEHFARFKSTRELRQRLKDVPKTTLFGTFAEYQAYFVKYVGLRSDKGLDLFNQITAIKEINRLNEFVRKHMLNVFDSQDLLDHLYSNYENLTLSYRAIVLAKEQLDELNPIAEEARKLDAAQHKHDGYVQRRALLPQIFATRKKETLSRQRVEREQQCLAREAGLAQLETRLQSLNQQKSELTVLLAQDRTGQELERFGLLLNQYEEKRGQRQKQAKQYARLANILGFSPELTVQDFSKNREQIGRSQSESDEKLKTLRDQLYREKKTQESHQDEVELLLAEYSALKKQKNRLPFLHVQLRDELANSLGVSPQTLPFIAELIRVKASEGSWEAAIERLLGSLALRLLVPQDLSATVSKWLQNKNTGVKLAFQKIDEEIGGKFVAPSSLAKESLFHKLDFHTRSSYVNWVREYIVKHFDYFCTDQLSIFSKQFKSITSQGFIKHGLTLYEKDDRFSVDDVSRYILGWDNKEKLEWLEARVQHLQSELDKSIQVSKKLHQTIERTEAELVALRDFAQIEEFTSIDWPSMVAEIEKIKKRQDSIAVKNGRASHLKKDLDKIERDLADGRDLRDFIVTEIALSRNALKTLSEEIEICQKIIKSGVDRDREPNRDGTVSGADSFQIVSEFVEKMLKKHRRKISDLTSQEFAIYEREIQDDLEKLARNAEIERQQISHSLVRKMAHFKARFSEQAVDLEATYEHLGEFLLLKTKLETDSLPEHERRFKKLLNNSLMNDMAAFKSTLELTYEGIQETVERLNQSLQEIHYSPTTYVQLQVTRSKDVEVRQFQNLLRHCLLDAQANEKSASLEEGFERVKVLLDRLKGEERWCKKVTDVRNWADFSVQERFLENHEAKNFYSDSAGLSGGQKAKLAFTILASAIAYQYGLHLDRSKDPGRSFRFIVVDEAFSKSDEKNSRYAMELFSKLGLQVMVVTPKDKIHVVEPYVKHIFLTQMRESQNQSQVFNLSLDVKANEKRPSQGRRASAVATAESW